MSNGHDDYCRKEGDLSAIKTELRTIKKFLMGNGDEGLVVTVPKLAQNVETLSGHTEDLKKGVNGLLKYQNEQIGKETSKRQNRWVFGILIGAILALLGAVVSLIVAIPINM